MAFVYVHGRERISARHPRAFGVCDRCGTQYSHRSLRWQYEWQGATLQNLRILVCRSCLDIPQPQLRTYVPPPDPLPIWNPRPEVDAGYRMQTYLLRGNNGLIIRANDSSVITVIGSQPGYPEALRDSEGNLLFDQDDVLQPVLVQPIYFHLGGPPPPPPPPQAILADDQSNPIVDNGGTEIGV